MSVKVTRSDHEGLFHGLVVAALVGVFEGWVYAEATGGGFVSFLMVAPIIPAVWTLGWLMFILTRPN
jgi:hypothetical protein